HAIPAALDAGACAEVRQTLERADEFGPAIGIPGVVERVHADDDVVRAEDLGPSQREREKDRVSRRDVGRGDVALVKIPIARDRDVRRERRAAYGAQVDFELEVLLDA